MICKTRKLKFKQNESDLKLRVKSGAPEGLVVLLQLTIILIPDQEFLPSVVDYIKQSLELRK